MDLEAIRPSCESQLQVGLWLSSYPWLAPWPAVGYLEPMSIYISRAVAPGSPFLS